MTTKAALLFAVVLAHAGCPMTSHPPIQTTDRPCMGTPKPMYDACGCHPRDDSFITRVTVLGIPDIARDEAKNCANGDLSLDVAHKQIVSASAKVCIEQSQKIDEASRKLLLQSLATAEGEAANKMAESELWRACYKKKAGL